MRRALFFFVAFLQLACSQAVAEDIQGQGSGFAMYKARRLAEVVPYDPSRQFETYLVFRRLAQLSLGPLFTKEVGETKTDTIPGFPYLVLIDNDNDTAPDYFAYYSDGGETELYGPFFSLTGTGRPDWIVFPVGPVIDDQKEFIFLFSHWVDRNGDGAIDLIIREDIDLNRSGWPEKNTTAWISDNDYDGRIDTASHCVDTNCVEITPQDGVLDLKTFINPKVYEPLRIGDQFDEGLDAILSDLVAVTGRE